VPLYLKNKVSRKTLAIFFAESIKKDKIVIDVDGIMNYFTGVMKHSSLFGQIFIDKAKSLIALKLGLDV
jgi:hypothetical protein